MLCRSGVWRLDQQLKKTGNTCLLFHLLLLNVSCEVLEKVSKTREKVKCQEAEEMVALGEQVILLIAVAHCPCPDVGYHYCWLEYRERKYKLTHAKKTTVQVSGPVVEFSTPLSS